MLEPRFSSQVFQGFVFLALVRHAIYLGFEQAQLPAVASFARSFSALGSHCVVSRADPVNGHLSAQSLGAGITAQPV